MMSKFKKSHFLMLCFLAILFFITPLVSTSLRPKFLYLIINLLVIALCAEAGLLSALPKPHIEEIKRLASLVPTKIPEITSLVPKIPEIASLVPKIPEIASILPKIPEITSLVPKIPEIASLVPKIPEIASILPKIPEITSLVPKIPEIASILPKIPEITSLLPKIPEVASVLPKIPEITSILPKNPEIVSLVPRVLLERSASLKTISVVKVEEKVRKLLATPSLFFVGSAEPEEEEDEEEEEEEEEEVGEFTGQELFTKSEDFIGSFYKQLKMQRQDSWKERVIIEPFHDYLACN